MPPIFHDAFISSISIKLPCLSAADSVISMRRRTAARPSIPLSNCRQYDICKQTSMTQVTTVKQEILASIFFAFSPSQKFCKIDFCVSCY